MSTNIADAVPRLNDGSRACAAKRIGVLGDLMLDRYPLGTASRLSPEAAVPVWISPAGRVLGRGGERSAISPRWAATWKLRGYRQ